MLLKHKESLEMPGISSSLQRVYGNTGPTSPHLRQERPGKGPESHFALFVAFGQKGGLDDRLNMRLCVHCAQ